MASNKTLAAVIDRDSFTFGSIFYIAGQMGNDDLYDALYQILQDGEFGKTFGADPEHEKDGEGLFFALCRQDKYGILAEIRLPHRDNYRYSASGKPMGWSVHPGLMLIEWVYAEDIDELVTKAAEIAESHYYRLLERAKVSA